MGPEMATLTRLLIMPGVAGGKSATPLLKGELLTGAFTRTASRAELKRDLERVYGYFPRLRERRAALAGYTSGGEQQMTAIGRALMAHPSMILLDEPSMGLAPQLVEEIFEIVKNLNRQERVSLLLAEQVDQELVMPLARGHGHFMQEGLRHPRGGVRPRRAVGTAEDLQWHQRLRDTVIRRVRGRDARAVGGVRCFDDL